MPTADYQSPPPAPANITAPRRYDGVVAVIARSRRRRSNPLAVIPGWCVSTRPQMRNCASGNLEIPGSMLHIARNDVGIFQNGSRKIRRVGLTKNVDRIARLQVAPL